MATNPYINKIVFGNTTLIDLTSDTLTASKLALGYTAHDRSGAPITGTSTLDSDTTDADALASEILDTKTAYVNKVKVIGTMPNRGSVTGTITDASTPYSIQNGYHDGSGTVSVDNTNLTAGNIKKDITILGVTGTYEGSGTPTSVAKTVTPYTTQKSYNPTTDDNVDYYSGITVNAISYVETDNVQGGKTATIGDVAPV